MFPVGRLDRDSEGLLLFTNDGALTQSLLHPSHQVDKVYRVTVAGALDSAAERLMAQTELDGEPICSPEVAVLSRSDEHSVLRVTIHEGKNRQIRRMCEKAGLSVMRLVRMQEGNLLLGDLKPGKWRYLTATEIKVLKGR